MDDASSILVVLRSISIRGHGQLEDDDNDNDDGEVNVTVTSVVPLNVCVPDLVRLKMHFYISNTIMIVK